MENLPEELLSNILTRVLAKQLGQLRSVSKSWNALLSHFSFIKSHLQRSINNNKNNSHHHLILLAFYSIESSSSTYSEPPFSVHSCRRPSSSSSSSSPHHLDLELTNNNFIKLPPLVNPQFENANAVDIIGCVNGLICYTHGSDSIIHIWNPSLSAMLTLPPYSIPCLRGKPPRIYLRFGYDPTTDDYKVVKLTGRTGGHRNYIKRWLQTEIYSMRRGTWEFIPEMLSSFFTSISAFAYVCADGHDGRIHWLGCNSIVSDRIVAFDLSGGLFHEMLLPDSTQVPFRQNRIGVLAEKLCVMSCYYFNDADVYEVWVMDEYGVADSWVMRHVFSQLTGDTYAFGFTSSPHNEFVYEDDGYIVLHDPIANNKTVLGKICHGRCGPEKIVEYVDSLVWVAPPPT